MLIGNNTGKLKQETPDHKVLAFSDSQFASKPKEALLVWNNYINATASYRFPTLSGGFYFLFSDKSGSNSSCIAIPSQSINGVEYTLAARCSNSQYFTHYKPEETLIVEKDSFIFLGNTIPWSGFLTNPLALSSLRASFANTSHERALDAYKSLSLNQSIFKITGIQGMPEWEFNTNNSIGDCGFGALVGFSSNGRSNFIQKELLVLLTLFRIEWMLSNRAYLIFSTHHSLKMTDEYDPMSIIFEICKSGGSLLPILNPQHTDQNLPGVIENRLPARGRYFGVVTHYGLLNFYQSEYFKNLKLTL